MLHGLYLKLTVSTLCVFTVHIEKEELSTSNNDVKASGSDIRIENQDDDVSPPLRDKHTKMLSCLADDKNRPSNPGFGCFLSAEKYKGQNIDAQEMILGYSPF